MKICHVIQSYSPAIGGSEYWCQYLCEYLAQKGVVNKVLTLNLMNVEDFHISPKHCLPHPNKLPARELINGVFVRRYSLYQPYQISWKSVLVNFLLSTCQLRWTEVGQIFIHSPNSLEMYLKIFREVRDADIVHLHTFPYFHNLVGFLAAKWYRKKVIITPHFHPGHDHFEHKIFYAILKKSDAVICMSRYEKDYFVKKGLTEEKILVVGNSIRPEEYQCNLTEIKQFRRNFCETHQLPLDAQFVIFIGKKSIYKGFLTLIKAMKLLAKECYPQQLVLLIVGPDTEEFDLSVIENDKIKNLKIIDLGLVSLREKVDLISISDVLVLPSQFESFGRVFLEAWALGKPVIGSDRGGIPDIIRDAGLCIKYDDVIDLKEKTKEILSNTSLAQKLASHGKQKIENGYNINTIGTKVINSYRKILQQRHKVLIVSQLFPPNVMGGSEIVAFEHSRILKQMSYCVRVFAGKLDQSQNQYKVTRERKEEITRINLHQEDFDYRFAKLEKKEVQNHFRKFLLEFSPDIVHFHNIYAFSIGLIDECQKLHMPTVMTLHDFWPICAKNLLITHEGAICSARQQPCPYCPAQLFINRDRCSSISIFERNRHFMDRLNMSNLIISPSRYLIDRFIERGLKPELAKVVNNGIDVERFRSCQKARSAKIRFGYIGQVLYHKGVENFIEAVAGLRPQERQKITVGIYGGGEQLYEQYCRRLTQEFGLMDDVRFYGAFPNSQILSILKNVDVLVVPSIWPENCPVTIMEALASGTPILASRMGGIPELVEEGLTGYLHEYLSSLSLAQNMRKLIDQPEQIIKMKEACQRRAKEFELGHQVRIIAQNYEELLKGNKTDCVERVLN